MAEAKHDGMMTMYELIHRAHLSEVSEVRVIRTPQGENRHWIVAAEVNGKRIFVCTSEGVLKGYKRVQSLILRLEDHLPSTVAIKLLTRGHSTRRVFQKHQTANEIEA